jgi:hypothetical protein
MALGYMGYRFSFTVQIESQGLLNGKHITQDGAPQL